MYLLEQWHSKYGLLKISISIHLRKKIWIFKNSLSFKKNCFIQKNPKNFQKKYSRASQEKASPKRLLSSTNSTTASQTKNLYPGVPHFFRGYSARGFLKSEFGSGWQGFPKFPAHSLLVIRNVKIPSRSFGPWRRHFGILRRQRWQDVHR